MSRRYLVAGNWKMNGSLATNAELLDGLLAGAGQAADVEMLVCPPAVYIPSVVARLGDSGIAVGAQNLSEHTDAGAYTGEVQGRMLRELGCTHVIVGHSERRALYAETDAQVAAKFAAAQAAQLIPVLCLGESLDEREAGQTEAVLARQLMAVVEGCGIEAFAEAVVAYEPVWAIGTGRTASPEQAQTVHQFLRARLAGLNATIADSLRILYGGSVKADNASSLFEQPDVDGGLIGGASLKARDFLAICAAAQALN